MIAFLKSVLCGLSTAEMLMDHMMFCSLSRLLCEQGES